MNIEALKEQSAFLRGYGLPKAADAIDELIAWKGEQVPVAWVVEGDVCPRHLTSNEKYANMYPERTVTPLYDRPQKPVMLPDHKMFLRSVVVQYIEAAGGKVAE